ncbi:hypothetical protein EV702DRAFT_601467 [Suillus placidus]|uniref:Uncharacterized protein n=1 Tax=Suillus placidus TaxID=48579 RepID=A0A9P7D7S0_9AGAM|nr:hypothetical protein EV702DRAFT_601467 [Suillus placidus]
MVLHGPWLSRALANDSRFVSKTTCSALSEREYVRDYGLDLSWQDHILLTSLLPRGQAALTSALGKIDPVAYYSIIIPHHSDNIVANRYSNHRTIRSDSRCCGLSAEAQSLQHRNSETWVAREDISMQAGPYGSCMVGSYGLLLPKYPFLARHVCSSALAIAEPNSTTPAFLYIHSPSRVRTVMQLAQNMKRGRWSGNVPQTEASVASTQRSSMNATYDNIRRLCPY